MNAHIFRQYDIRGVVGPDLDAGVAAGIGRAFATRLVREMGHEHAASVVVGHDNRVSSPELAAAVIKGLRSSGANVIDIGTVPTPVHSFATVHFAAHGGIQVTGSHNPAEYNGFKLSSGGRSLYGAAIQQLRTLIDTRDFVEGQGTLEDRAVLETYTRDISSRFTITRPLRVVVDCGNGTGSLVAVELLQALGPNVHVDPLFCDSDGSFPNHHPDPVVDENLADLRARVRETGADLGIAFDGDADRIGAVDDQGEIVRGDTLLLLYGLDLVQRRGPGQPVVFDVKCSQVLPEVLERAGGKPIMSQTGHSLIKERMKREGALLAGELSGHIMFGDEYFGFDDALYGACLLLQIVARAERPLSSITGEFPRFVSTAEIRYPSTEEGKWEIVQRATEHFRRGHHVIDVDGARVLFGDGWGLIRASNTEPVLVARYEARTAARLADIRAEMESWLVGAGVAV